MVYRNDLSRFHIAQRKRTGYEQAYREIQAGRKVSHWIWYIFPQLQVLGASDTAQYYGISNFKEACDYLIDPVLFNHYYAMVQLVEQHIGMGRSLHILMGGPIDAKKLVSSLTLFSTTAAYLVSIRQQPIAQFKALQERCDTILAQATQENYTPCERTLFTIQPELDSALASYRVSQIAELTLAENLTARSQLLIQQLEDYKNARENEWGFHFNFLGIMSVLYYLQDKLCGTDHFNSKSREVKISAAMKIKDCLEHPEEEQNLTPAEKQALEEGRLGDIISEHGGIDQVLQINSAVSVVRARFS